MMKMIFSLCFMFIASTAFAAPVPSLDTDKYCKELSAHGGGSAVVENECRKMEARAKEAAAQMEAPQRAVKACLDLVQYGASYVVFHECLKMEKNAIEQLQ